MIARTAVLAALLSFAGAPAAQEPAPSPPAAAGGEGDQGTQSREQEMFGQPPAAQAEPPPPAPVVTKEKEDPLHVGGQIYLRAVTVAQQGQAPADWALAAPDVLDVYLDVRPNDRVRGFTLGRMFYDPTTPRVQSGAGTLLGALPANPSAVLDQLWVNFDVARTAFVTAGKQHVKWGVGRFWNPTDWLHAQRRDPLAVFDVRSGASMLKVHVPWERRGWNVYGIALVEDLDRIPQPAPEVVPSSSASPTIGQRLAATSLGGRAEIVLGPAELGLDVLAKDGRRPRFGVDLSAGVWDLDLYAGLAVRTSPDLPRYREVAPGASLVQRWALDQHLGFVPAVVAGGEWSAKYSDEDVVTVGAEYFFDDTGYDSPAVYPFLLAGAPQESNGAIVRDPGAFTPFYLGRHYAGVFVLLPSPGSWNDTTFTLSGIGNLSDRSFVVRLDHSVLALTYLRVETYVAGRLGARDGEFRLGFTLTSEELGGLVPAPIVVLPTVFEAGVALRVSL